MATTTTTWATTSRGTCSRRPSKSIGTKHKEDNRPCPHRHQRPPRHRRPCITRRLSRSLPTRHHRQPRCGTKCCCVGTCSVAAQLLRRWPLLVQSSASTDSRGSDTWLLTLTVTG